MSHTVLMMGALVTLCDTRITCDCGTSTDVADLLETKQPNRGYWTRTCKGCREVLAISTDITGDAICWNYKEGMKAKREYEKALKNQPQPTEEEIAAFLAAAPGPHDHEEEARQLLARFFPEPTQTPTP